MTIIDYISFSLFFYFNYRSRTILASEFQVDNKANIEAVKRMGITVLRLADGRINFLRNASQVLRFSICLKKKRKETMLFIIIILFIYHLAVCLV